MKKIYLLFALVTILSQYASNPLLSQESGWEQHVGYKYQKLFVGKLNAVQTSPNGQFLYTYSDILITWDFQTGRLLDSVRFSPQPSNCYFSKDGRTAVLAYTDTLNALDKIKLYDLTTKKIIGESRANLSKTFTFSSTGLWHVWQGVAVKTFDLATSTMDYNSSKNELHLQINTSSSQEDHKGDQKYEATREESGCYVIMEKINDTLVQKRNVHGRGVLDYLYYNDSLLFYITRSANLFEAFDFELGLNSLQYQSLSYLNTLNKLNISTNKDTTLLHYLIENDKKSSDSRSYILDHKTDISRIYPTKMKDTIIYKSGTGNKAGRYYVYNSNGTAPASFSFSVNLTTPNVIETMLNTQDILAIYDEYGFKFVRLTTGSGASGHNWTRDPIKTIDYYSHNILSPFIMTKDDKSLVAITTQGEILVFDTESVVAVTEEKASELADNRLYPNPTTGMITLDASRFHPGKIRIELTDIAGRSILLFDGMNEKQELRFDISSKPKGTYMITTCQDGVYEVMKCVKE